MATTRYQALPYSAERLRSQVAGSLLIATLAALIAAPAALAAPDAVEKAEWNGYEMLKFNVAGRSALLVVPKSPAAGKPWIWRTEFFGVAPQADIQVIKKPEAGHRPHSLQDPAPIVEFVLKHTQQDEASADEGGNAEHEQEGIPFVLTSKNDPTRPVPGGVRWFGRQHNDYVQQTKNKKFNLCGQTIPPNSQACPPCREPFASTPPQSGEELQQLVRCLLDQGQKIEAIICSLVKLRFHQVFRWQCRGIK